MDFLVATGCQNSPTQLPNIVTPNVSPTQDSFDDGDALPTLNISPDNRDPSADDVTAVTTSTDIITPNMVSLVILGDVVLPEKRHETLVKFWDPQIVGTLRSASLPVEINHDGA